MGIRPIDANALVAIFKDKYCDVVAGRYPFNIVVYDLVKITEQQPTLDYEPVRHGEWIQMVDAITNRKVGYRCSECGLILRKKYDYCNCGAKMGKGDA